MQNNSKVSFENTANAFAYKNDTQLKKAHFLFSSMGYQWLVNIGTRITPWAIKVKLPIKGIIRKTIFEQFVGGETLEQTAKVADKLEEFHVQVILDYGVEGGDYGEEEKDHSCSQFISVINYAATQANIPFMSVKVTGIARFALLEKMDGLMANASGTLVRRYEAALEQLGADEKAEWQRVCNRMEKICSAAAAKKVGVLIDAEETWIQDPVDALTMLMMDQYNKTTAVLYNTAQLYRHDRYQFLCDCYEAAEQRNFILGIKIVRGAYMEKERERAAAMNYPSPIQPDKETCDRDYNRAVEFCLAHVERIATIVASHNEQSNLLAAGLLHEKGLPHNHPHVHFSQLYGMSDHITFNLAKEGYSVSKYLPFGPIEDVVPYLMRRAQENSSVSGQTGRELALIKKELKRRGV
ncbi:proline dehydrogenase [Lacibacter luteus]|uniref:Proline dehydrogenase n=1 Tax=Lacibacter luteus TaxID=2508719 RepID=A0A4Q1CMY7_9BACT|nr:proline dehydrogenase family protein [Lacibacter luteus]RXK62416.1 proline dehydrogenase [Lacibacter luteus]